jgi:hypothetical protein
MKCCKNIYIFRKKIFYFHAYGQVSQRLKKKIHIVVQHRKFQKTNVLACIFGFNNKFIKVTKTKPIFQKFKNNLFCFF